MRERCTSLALGRCCTVLHPARQWRLMIPDGGGGGGACVSLHTLAADPKRSPTQGRAQGRPPRPCSLVVDCNIVSQSRSRSCAEGQNGANVRHGSRPAFVGYATVGQWPAMRDCSGGAGPVMHHHHHPSTVHSQWPSILNPRGKRPPPAACPPPPRGMCPTPPTQRQVCSWPNEKRSGSRRSAATCVSQGGE